MTRLGGCSWVAVASALVAITRAPVASAQTVGRFPDPAGSDGAAPAATSFPASAAQPQPPADSSASSYPRDPPAGASVQGAQGAAPPPLTASGYAQPYQNRFPNAGAAAGGFYPAVLPYREGQPVPEGYRLEERRNHGLATGGIVTFSISYAIGLGYALASGFEDGTGWLALPLAGPWAAIGAQEIECNRRSLDNDCVEQALGGAERITFFTVDGLLQALGLTLIFVGVGMKTQELVRTDVATLGVELKPRSLGLSGTF